MLKTIISGTGAYIPDVVRLNEDFLNDDFYEEGGKPVNSPTHLVIEKFHKITGIRERRYVPSHLISSDIAAEAGRQALNDSGIDPETLDQIIVAHNFGDITHDSNQSQNVPSLANRVKHKLRINNPDCIGYDVVCGCPGWVQGLIQTEAYFKAGMANKILLIGTEILSRVIDRSDRDSMLFADGAGACVLEYKETGIDGSGIIASCASSHSLEEVDYINMRNSYKSGNGDGLYMKMKGRKVYEYALKYVPPAIKHCLDSCGIHISQVSKLFIHQANEKMDEEIVTRLYGLYGRSEVPHDILPMSIQWLGNSSVATVPTLYHMVRKAMIPGHRVQETDLIVFASVGAGMNINAVCYRV